MKKQIAQLGLLSLASIFCLMTFAYADSFVGGRQNAQINYYLDASAIQYGYAPHFNRAAKAWNGISASVNLKEVESPKGADLYMVGNSSIDGLLGAHVPYQKGFLGKPKVVSEYDFWQFSSVVLFHNNMVANGLTYHQRVSNAIHEIGHTLSLAHPSQTVPSVMKQGISDLMPTSYDRFELINKWQQSQSNLKDHKDTALRLHANYEAYETVPDADKGADLIIIASPTNDFSQRSHVIKTFTDGQIMDFYTKTVLKISKVIKADARVDLSPSMRFTVLEPAAVLETGEESQLLTYEGYNPMSLGSTYIVFLKRNDFGQYSVMNMSLGTIDTLGPKALMKAATSTESAPVDADKSAGLSPEDQFINEALNFYHIK